MSSPSIEVSPDSPVTAESIMIACHREIIEAGDYPFACNEIALAIAGARKVYGLESGLLELEGETDRPLIPRALEGKVSWASHMVCCDVVGELVYDPVHGAPMPLEAYFTDFFVSPPNVRGIVAGRQLTALLDKRELLREHS